MSTEKKQINILVPKVTKEKYDELMHRWNALIMGEGHHEFAKGELVALSLYKYLTDSLDLAKSVESAKRKLAIDNKVEEARQILEELFNV